MDDRTIVDFIKTAFDDIEILEADSNSFFYYSPEHVIPEKTFPWATLVSNDLYDQFSDLGRDGVYRLNVGVSAETFKRLFPEEREYNFKALDTLMPHPIYGNVRWVSVLRPSEQTFEQDVKPLLEEAYQAAVRAHDRRAAREAERS
jgi:hypothetical protein